MKASELREYDEVELREQLRQSRSRLFELRTEFHTDEQPDTSEKTKLRKDIARVLTILRERELESGESGEDSNLAQSGAQT